MASYKSAIKRKCRDCCYDARDRETAAQQIAACMVIACPLHEVRPITCASLPVELIRYWGIDPEKLDKRARSKLSNGDAESSTLARQFGHESRIDAEELEEGKSMLSYSEADAPTKDTELEPVSQDNAQIGLPWA